MRIDEIISIDPVVSTFERLFEAEFVANIERMHSTLAVITNNFTRRNWPTSSQSRAKLLAELGAHYDYAAKVLGPYSRKTQTYALIQEMISYLDK